MATILAQKTDAQYEGRSFTVSAAPAKASVGDTVRLRFRLVAHERDLLTDSVPRPVGQAAEGMRVLAVERLRRGADRVFTGSALVAFYRPGLREVPAFGVPWMQIVSGRRGTAATEAGAIEIVPVLPAGNPTLRDIREVEPAPGPAALPLFLGGLLLAAIAVLLLRRRATPPAPIPVPAPPPPALPPDPYRQALQRLEAIGQERRAHRGEVVLHYQAVADALRDYLEAAEEIPARERTTTELLWALPPRLTEGGLRRLAGQLLGEADLVKFARRRPDAGAADQHLREARELLRRWHEAGSAAREPDAVR